MLASVAARHLAHGLRCAAGAHGGWRAAGSVAVRAAAPAAVGGGAAGRRAAASPCLVPSLGFLDAAAGGLRTRWATAGLRAMSDTPAQQESSPAPDANPEHEFDPDLLRALEIDHIPPAKIAETLKSENITIHQLKMLVDEGFHDSSSVQGGPPPVSPGEQAALSRNAAQWSPDLVHQINPRRRFFPGQTYLPEELSPNYQVDYVKLREEQRKLGCPLGGKKGPKIDYTNVALLSRCVCVCVCECACVRTRVFIGILSWLQAVDFMMKPSITPPCILQPLARA
jgi:hypothetical protein